MKHYLSIILLLLIAMVSHGQVKIAADGSMQATGNYPVTYQRSLKGYVISVKGLAERNAIPSNFRDTGMIILVRDSSYLYSLVGGIANSNWQLYSAASGISGGDTTIFNPVIDSTGQSAYRVLYGRGNNHIGSDPLFLYDSIHNKLVINAANFSIGGNNTKLYVNGNSTIGGNLTNNGNTTIRGTATISTTATGAAGTDSVLVQNNGLIKKISPTYYGTGSSSGTVTSVATNTGSGITGGTITTTGTIAADTTILSTKAHVTDVLQGYVPTSRTVNGKALSSNITLGLASSDFANQGTATTVLHGNGAGNPSFTQVVNADITNATIVASTKLSATGTPSATTFLRGDDTWSAPSGTSVSVFDSLTWISAKNYNILPTNSEATNTTNATTAINFLITKNGGTLFFPYADSAYKVRIQIPSIADSDWSAIRILGATPPKEFYGSAGTATLPINGVILKSSDTTSGNAVIKYTTGANLDLYLENLDIRTYDSTKISGVNVSAATYFHMKNCFVNTGVYNTQAKAPARTNTFGVRTPLISNGSAIELYNVAITGFYTGLEANEHTMALYNNIASCVRAISFRGSYHAIDIIASKFFRNTYNLYFDTTIGAGSPNYMGVNVVDADIEHEPAILLTPSTAWQQTLYDLFDSTNIGKGSVTWQTTLGGGGTDSSFTKNGGLQIQTGTHNSLQYLKYPLNISSDNSAITATALRSSQASYLSTINTHGNFLRMGIDSANAYSFLNTDALRYGLFFSSVEKFSFLTGGFFGINNNAAGNKLTINTPITTASTAQALIYTNSTTNKGLVIQGAASQTAALQEWQTSGGLALADINTPNTNTTVFELTGQSAGKEAVNLYFDGNDHANAAYAGFGISTSGSWLGVTSGFIIASSKNGTGTQLPIRIGGFSGSWTDWMTISTAGKVGIGVASGSSSALLHIKAGTASANTAPLKFTSGTNLTTAEAGAVEYDGSNLYFTPTGTIRKVIPTNVTGRSTAQTAAVATVVTQTVGSSDASYYVSANVLVTTSSAENFTVTVAYTDEGNTARTLTLNFQTIAGVLGTAIAFANGAVPYEGVPTHLRCKGGTTITIKSAAGGTYTGCTYNIEGNIIQTN